MKHIMSMTDLTLVTPSNPIVETQEERLERLRGICERKCDRENKREGRLNEFDGYNCDVCNNKGYILRPQLYDNFYQEIQITCKCEKVRKSIRALKRSGLQSVVQDFTFERYIAKEEWQKNILTLAQNYLKNSNGEWFYFGGNSGCGKTHICTAIATALIEKDLEVKYMLWRDEVTQLKGYLNSKEYSEKIEHFKDVDVLYIDDLFKTGKNEFQTVQRPTPADINLAFEILNTRAFRRKITIISSECTFAELLNIDEAIAGRIKRECGDYLVNISKDIKKNYRLYGSN